MLTYQTPGVYREEVLLTPAAGLRTGVPAFLGYTARGPLKTPQMLTLWPHFEENFGGPLPNDSYLAYAVRGFFENGGRLCYIVRLDETLLDPTALRDGLAVLAPLETIDLICAPDITRPPSQRRDVQRELHQDSDLGRKFEATFLEMQSAVLEHCETLGDRFAILDSWPVTHVDSVLRQRQRLEAKNGALYFPWIRAMDGPVPTGGLVPPCGHVAGVYARVDRGIGVHKAPANESTEGVLDLEVDLSNAQQGSLNPEGINCLRAFPGRGIRVWGARTLSREPAWIYVNVRRLFLTAGRWIERNMSGVAFEPNDARLWARIVRELTAYFNGLFERGALKGNTPQEAYTIKCDAETNPPEVREVGMVVTEIGLAPAIPQEFVVVRIIHGASGVTIVGPVRPE